MGEYQSNKTELKSVKCKVQGCYSSIPCKYIAYSFVHEFSQSIPSKVTYWIWARLHVGTGTQSWASQTCLYLMEIPNETKCKQTKQKH